MSVVIETTVGDITVDLFLQERPRACLNFLKLCKIKYYNYNLFHTISRGFIAQSGDPTGTRKGGESIFGVIHGQVKRYFEAENEPRIKHTRAGLISFVSGEDNMIGSQFFLTLGDDLTYLDEKHCVFGEVVEGINILEIINEAICDTDDRPYQDVRITHTVVLDDPYPDPKGLDVPSRSPSPSAERLAGGRIAADEEIDEATGKTAKEVAEFQADREAKARATILEMIGDIPDAEMAPPENVLFVCKLNPVTNDDDLEIIFSRFGKIKTCEVIRDRKTGDSLQYAFIEFEEQKSCEDAYFKMDNVLIDDRRIHVDFSQSVSKVKWLGKGRGVAYYDEKGKIRQDEGSNEIGKGNYKVKNGVKDQNDEKRKKVYNRSSERERRRSKSPIRNNKRDRSPDRDRKRSRSPKRERKRSISPLRKRNRSRSPNRIPRRNYRQYTPHKRYRSPLRRSYASSRYPRSPRRRSRSPRRRIGTSERRSRRSRSPIERSMSPPTKTPNSPKRNKSSERTSRISKTPNKISPDRNLRRLLQGKDIGISHRSESRSSDRSSNKKREKSRGSTSRSSKQRETKLSNATETSSSEEVEISSNTQNKNKSSAKETISEIKEKKDSKISDSSDQSDSSSAESEEDYKKKKKRAKRKKQSSSSSSEDSSSSEEEKIKKKAKKKNKKDHKKKKSKKSKRKKKISSSSSESSSSESDRNYRKKKKCKRRRTKSSSDSDSD